MLGNQKKIHFIGIGGIGMSGMAELLNNLGHIITGSDLLDSDRIQHLKEIGLDISIGHNINNINNHDLVVFSSAVNLENPEIIESKRQNIPVIKRAEMLGELLKVKPISVAVAGTHGKTTTSSMLNSILTKSDHKPTLIVGGIVQGLLANSILGDGDTIIVEADEYDRTLLSLKASMSIVTNIDFEHSDCYENIESLKETFLSFLNATSFYGINVVCYDDLNIKASNFENIVGKDPEYNGEKIREIFEGKDNDFSIAVCLNAAAGLLVAEKSNSFKDGYKKLREHILSGKVINHISKLTK